MVRKECFLGLPTVQLRGDPLIKLETVTPGE